MELPTVKRINECFIKPKLQENYSNKPYFLTSWDLRLLSIHCNQKGLLFTKPSPKDESFSFDNLLESLKDSLALTLVHFYPLAGQLATRIDEDNKCVVFIDCNKGPGAQFLHATLDITVPDILSPTYIPKVVHSLFDNDKCTVVNLDGRSRPLLSIQITELVDGVFIGCSMNHAIVDGTSFWHFWKVWSEIHNVNSRPISISRPPLLIGKDSPLLLSLNNNELDEFVVRYEPPPELMERMFYFTSESMKKLKAKANKDSINNGSGVIISSFQALAALIWRAIDRAYELAPNEVTNCHLAVNVRKRLDPSLPDDYFGNVLSNIMTNTTAGELLNQSLGMAASLLNGTIRKYTNGNGAVRSDNHWAEAPSFIDLSTFSDLRSVRFGSSPRFEIYSNEFKGLGRPVAVRSGNGNKFIGKVNTYPGCEGGGSVDFEICLLPQQIALLESDQEFMNFASLTI